jgi:DNA-binding NarL/FixJ family response regulator
MRRGQQPAKGGGGCMSHTILIVDDSELIRHSLRSCIEQNSDWEVCGEAENGAVAVDKVKELHPDVVILDLQMPVMNGIEAAQQISHLAPSTAMLMFTMHECEQVSQDAHAAGVKDVFSKFDAVADHLLASLRNVGDRPQRLTMAQSAPGVKRGPVFAEGAD